MNSKNLSKAINRMLAILLTAAMVAGSFTVPVKASEPVIEEEPGSAADNNAAGEVVEEPDEPVDDDKALIEGDYEDISGRIKVQVNFNTIGGTYGDAGVTGNSVATAIEDGTYVTNSTNTGVTTLDVGATKTYAYRWAAKAEELDIDGKYTEYTNAQLKALDNSATAKRFNAGYYRVYIEITDNVNFYHGETSFDFVRNKKDISAGVYGKDGTAGADGKFTITWNTTKTSNGGMNNSAGKLVYTPATASDPKGAIVPGSVTKIEYTKGSAAGSCAMDQAIDTELSNLATGENGQISVVPRAGTGLNDLSNASVEKNADHSDLPYFEVTLENVTNYCGTFRLPFEIGKVASGTPYTTDTTGDKIDAKNTTFEVVNGVSDKIYLDNIILNEEGNGYEEITNVTGSAATSSTTPIVPAGNVSAKKDANGKWYLFYTAADSDAGDTAITGFKLAVRNYTDPVAVTFNFVKKGTTSANTASVELNTEKALVYTGTAAEVVIDVTDAKQAATAQHFKDSYTIKTYFYSIKGTGETAELSYIGTGVENGSSALGNVPYGRTTITAPAGVKDAGGYRVRVVYESTLTGQEVKAEKEFDFTIAPVSGNVLTITPAASWSNEKKFVPGGAKLVIGDVVVAGLGASDASLTTGAGITVEVKKNNLLNKKYSSTDRDVLKANGAETVAEATKNLKFAQDKNNVSSVDEIFVNEPYAKIVVNSKNYDNAFGYIAYSQSTGDSITGTGKTQNISVTEGVQDEYTVDLNGIFKVGDEVVAPSGGYSIVASSSTVAGYEANGTPISAGIVQLDTVTIEGSTLKFTNKNNWAPTNYATFTITGDFTNDGWTDTTKTAEVTVTSSKEVEIKAYNAAGTSAWVPGNKEITSASIDATFKLIDKDSEGADVDTGKTATKTYWQLAKEVYSTDAVSLAKHQSASYAGTVFKAFDNKIYTCMAYKLYDGTAPSTPLNATMTQALGTYVIEGTYAASNKDYTIKNADKAYVSFAVTPCTVSKTRAAMTFTSGKLDTGALNYLGANWVAFDALLAGTTLDDEITIAAGSSVPAGMKTNVEDKTNYNISKSAIYKKVVDGATKYYVTITATPKDTVNILKGSTSLDIEIKPYTIKANIANAWENDRVHFVGKATTTADVDYEYDYSGSPIKPAVKKFDFNYTSGTVANNNLIYKAQLTKAQIDALGTDVVSYTVTYPEDATSTGDKEVTVNFNGLIKSAITQKYTIKTVELTKLDGVGIANKTKNVFADAEDKVIEIQLPMKGSPATGTNEYNVTYTVAKTTDGGNRVVGSPSVDNKNVLKFTLAAGAATGSGVIVLTLTPKADNCIFNPTTFKYTISVVDPALKSTINWTAPSNKVYDGEAVDYFTGTITKGETTTTVATGKLNLKYTLTKKVDGEWDVAHAVVNDKDAATSTVSDAGEYKVKVEIGGSLSGTYVADPEYVEGEFTISKKEITVGLDLVDDNDEALGTTGTYEEGKPVSVNAKLTIPAGIELNPGYDYTISGEKTLTEPGVATVKVEPTVFSNYTFTPVEKTYSLVPGERESVKGTIKLVGTDGKPIVAGQEVLKNGLVVLKKAGVSVEADGYTLEQDKDYKVTIDPAEPVSEGTVTVSIEDVGTSKYEVTADPVSFKIIGEKVIVPTTKVTVGDKEIGNGGFVLYDEKAKTVSVELKDEKGEVIPAADYTVEITKGGVLSEVKEPGEYKIAITCAKDLDYSFETIEIGFSVLEKAPRVVQSVSADPTKVTLNFGKDEMKTAKVKVSAIFDVEGETLTASDIDYEPKMVGAVSVSVADDGIVTFETSAYGDKAPVEYTFWVDGDKTKIATVAVTNKPESSVPGEAEPGTPVEEPSEDYEKPSEAEYKDINESGLSIIASKAYTYTGKPIQAAVKVAANPNKLVNGTDYKITYADNVSAGKGKILVSGIGQYNGLLKDGEIEFTINPKKASGFTVVAGSMSADEAKEFDEDDAYAVNDRISVYDGTTKLWIDDDYTIESIAKSSNGKKIDFVIKGAGNYDSNTQKKASIAIVDLKGKKDIGACTISDIEDKNYTGSAIKPTVTVEDEEGNTVSSANYTVTYKNNTNRGVATVTVKGKKEYAGSKVTTFNIVSPEVDPDKEVTITVNGGKPMTYTGKLLKPSVKVQVQVGEKVKTLSKNKDYAIYYGSELNAGTGRVVIRGLGNYAEILTDTPKEFTINKADFKKVSIKKNSSKQSGVYFNNKKLVVGEDFVITNVDTSNLNKCAVTVIVPEGGSTNFQGNATKTIKGKAAQIDWVQLGLEDPSKK